MKGLKKYGKSVIKIARSAIIRVSNGAALYINRSWFNWHNPNHISELIIEDGGTLVVNGNYELYNGSSIYISKGAVLQIEGDGFINTNSSIECYHQIHIGKGTIISDNCRIQDSDIHKIKGSEPSSPIFIGNHVWIGMNSIILKGVSIGDGAVIGAGSVVTRDIPAGALAAGVPARVIRNHIEWEI